MRLTKLATNRNERYKLCIFSFVNEDIARPVFIGRLPFATDEPRYLAVEASCIPGTQLNAEFSAKLDRSETTGSFFTQSGIDDYPMVVYGVMLLIPRPIGLSGGKDMFSSTYRLGKRWCESAIKWLDTSGWAVRLGKFG